MDRHFADMLKDEERQERRGSGSRPDSGHSDGRVFLKGSEAAVVEVGGTYKHAHARLGAQSVGIELVDGPLDWLRFTAWLRELLRDEAERVWRLKGILWTTGGAQRGLIAGRVSADGPRSYKRTVVQVRRTFHRLTWLDALQAPAGVAIGEGICLLCKPL